jgi:elongation factor Ts
MATITAALVKELRDKTGAGMMDCKTALTETGGAMEEAVDWLRKKGLSKAAKKADRIAAEGLIGVTATGKTGAVVEVNSETDFVARNEKFQDMVRKITSVAPAAGGKLEALLAATYPGAGETVEAAVKEAVATIGENMNVRRTAVVSVKDGVIADYTHNKIADGLGKIGVLVGLESAGDKAKLAELGRQIALHVAAANPQAVSVEELDPAIVARERSVYIEQAKAAGKSEEIAQKMVEGRLRKEFFQQVVLLQQTFMGPGGDGKLTVEQVVKEAEKAAGGKIVVAAFVRYALGEGIDKKTDDFAAEVAAAVRGS